MKDSQNIDFEKIQTTTRELNNIENTIHNKNLINSFYEIEEYIKNINFIHTNCITNYKDSLSILLNNYNKMVEEITRLNSTLSKTLSHYSEIKTKDNTGNIFSNTKTELKEVTKVPLPEQNDTTVSENSNISTEINTVPIGLGIATTGIVASAGAVIYDEYKRKNKNNLVLDKFEPIEDTSIEIEDDVEDSDMDIMSNENKQDLKTPAYQATRTNNNLDKFYGENVDYYEDEDN